jgi:hypothetical protein
MEGYNTNIEWTRRMMTTRGITYMKSTHRVTKDHTFPDFITALTLRILFHIIVMNWPEKYRTERDARTSRQEGEGTHRKPDAQAR